MKIARGKPERAQPRVHRPFYKIPSPARRGDKGVRYPFPIAFRSIQFSEHQADLVLKLTHTAALGRTTHPRRVVLPRCLDSVLSLLIIGL